jgi:hypothetical protein
MSRTTATSPRSTKSVPADWAAEEKQRRADEKAEKKADGDKRRADERKRKADEKMRKAELFKAQDGAQEEQLLPATPVKLYTYWKKGKWLKDLVAHASDMVTYVDDVVESMSSGSWCVSQSAQGGQDDRQATLAGGPGRRGGRGEVERLLYG